MQMYKEMKALHKLFLEKSVYKKKASSMMEKKN